MEETAGRRRFLPECGKICHVSRDDHPETLAAGLGLHYALFFERRTDSAAEERRTLHATLICVGSAVLVFGLLATSTLPVLRAIGLTVALGVGFHFCLSTQMARPRPAQEPSRPVA